MPRPLHERNVRNPTKIQNNHATPVGADRCVGPLRTRRFRPRAHTQVRPYKATMVAFADHKREPGGLPPTGGLITQEQTPEYPPAKRCGCGHWPRAGRPSADRRSDVARTNTGIPSREAVRLRALPAREAIRLRPLAARPRSGPAAGTARPQSPHASPLILVVFWPNGAGSRKLSLNFKKTFGKSIEKRRRWQYTKAVFIFP